MPCTPYDIIPFANKTSTTIGWAGYTPTVEVYYLQENGTFQQLNTSITLTTDQVIVDHGGPATGFVKITDCPIIIPPDESPVLLISEIEEFLLSETGLNLIAE